MLPIINLSTDLDLSKQIVQETGVTFYFIVLEVVTIMAQSQTKYDLFLTQYLFDPYVYRK